jgi:hypothetical protein
VTRGRVLAGVAAGTVGTAALHAATYLDMALRGRPASRTPEQSVEALAARIGVAIPGAPETRGHRLEGLAALLGLATSAGLGAAVSGLDAAGGDAVSRLPVGWLGLLFSGSALVVANAPMAALGVTDPRRWDGVDWLSDVVPHLAYGFAAAFAYRAMGSRG